MSGKWSCPTCTLENEGSHRHCQMCQARRPPSNSSGLVESWINKRRRKRKRKSPNFVESDFSGGRILKVRIVMDNAEATDGKSAFWENQPLEAVFPAEGRVEIDSATEMHESQERRLPELEEKPEQSEGAPSDAEVDEPAAKAGNDETNGDVEGLSNLEAHSPGPVLSSNDPDATNDDLQDPKASKSLENTPISDGDLAPRMDDDRDDPMDDTTNTIDGQSCAQQLLAQSPESTEKSIAGSAGCESPTENDLSVDRDDGADQNLDGKGIDLDSNSMRNEKNAPMSQSVESHQSSQHEEAAFSQSSRENGSSQSSSPGDSQGGVHFSQLLTQQHAGFMYTQAMSQMDDSAMNEDDGSATEASASRTEKSVLSSSQTETTPVSSYERAPCPDPSRGPENSTSDDPSSKALVAPDLSESIASTENFRTPGRESMMSVSEEDMTKSAKLFEGEKDADAPTHPGQNEISCQPMAGFATAGKRTQIEVSEASLRRAATVLAGPETATADVKHPPAQFQTAGRKSTINVSVESIARASKLLDDGQAAVSLPPEGPKSSEATASFMTAGSRSKIHITDESMGKASRLLRTSDYIISSRAPKRFLPGFQTAGRQKRIAVSEESIARASSLLGEVGDPKKERVEAIQAKEPSHAVMFQAAGSGKAVAISEESMARASRLLDHGNFEKGTIESELPQPVSSFHTAGSRTRLEVSDDSLASALRILGGDDVADKAPVDSEDSKPMASGFASFQTAGLGKKIEVSDESLSKASSLLQDSRDGANTPAVSFQTALSGTSVSVSEESMKKASLLFANDSGPAAPESSRSSVPTFAAFQTAGSGKTLEVSDESLAKASSLLQNSRDETKTTSIPVISFQTAGSGASVTVSEESMKKASLLFANDSGTAAPKSSRSSIPAFAAFQSAGSGKKLEISDESLAKASSLLQNSRDETKTTSIPVISFQTAGSGASLTVSEESMKKASLLFENGSRSAVSETTADEGSEAPRSSFAAFQSAGSGKEILVSEASLKKAAEVLDSSGMQAETENRHMAAFRTAGSRQTISVSDEDVRKAAMLLKSQEVDAGKSSPARQARSVSFAAAPVVTAVPARQDLVQVDGNKENEPGYSRTGAEDAYCLDITQPQAIESDDDEIEKGGSLFHSQDSIPTAGRKSLLSLDQRAITLAHHGGDPENSSSNRASTSGSETSDLLEAKTGTSLPSFTPSHDAGPRAAAVTLSAKLRNPYLRESPDDSRNLSPVPLNLRHAQGTFRNKPISPATLARAESLLADTIEDENSRNLHLKNDEPPDQLVSVDIQATMNDDPDVCLRHGVNKIVLALDSVNATRLRFDSDTGLPCVLFGQAPPPGHRLIGSVTDFRSTLVERGCDETILGDKWLSNHMRWIIWKLASIERRFPTLSRSKRLSFEEVVNQLQKRYAKELIGGIRPAIRKVLNRDIASTNMMVLVVSQVFRQSQGSTPECRVELSDGWYSIPALLDSKLSAIVDKGTIAIGTKLLVCNAHLLGADDGIDPLDASYDPSRRGCTIGLQLVANATRLARWDAKLGFVRPCRALRASGGSLLLQSLRDVVPGGGNIPLIDLVVCRSYPRMFLERNGNPNEIDLPVISEAEEYMKRMEFEKHRQMSVEKISDDVQKECEKEVDEMAPAVWKEMTKTPSPDDYYERLSAVDRESVDKWRDKRDMLLQNMIQREVESRLDDDQSLFRECTPFIRVFVKSFPTNDPKGKSREFEGALLTVWSPTEKQLSLLKEGMVVRLQNLSVRSTKFDGLLQLTGGAKTTMDKSPAAPATPGGLKAFGYRPRSFVTMLRTHALSQKIARKLIPSSPAPEVDMAGIALRVVEDDGSGACPTMFLTDESGLLVRIKPEGTTLREIEGVRSLSRVALHNLERPLVVALRDLRVLHYDSIECCAVAAYVSTSSLATHSAPRISALQKWAETSHGQGCLRHVAACLDVGIPTLRDPTNANLTAIGYLADVTIPSDGEQRGGLPAHLWVHVDCGMDKEQIWEFPVYLLNEAASICGTASDDVSLPASTRERYEKLKSLNRVFGARGCLLRFGLIQKQQWYQVRSIAPVDIKALATTHVALIQRRQHIQEEEKARKRDR